MALPYYPHRGEVLICDFDAEALGAEMVKRRPVIVVSRRETHNRKLCAVVPISTTAPDPIERWHHALPHLRISGWSPAGLMWAKCDMLATVSFDRLNKPYVKTRHGRNYVTHKLDDGDLGSVLAGISAFFAL
jgi:uncharacterized protein YifN (PemK superfamily)